MKTGEKIAKARKALNLTQELLAERLNVSRQTVSKWELDEAFPEVSKLVKLADLLNVSCDYLLREDGSITASMTMAKDNSFTIDWTAVCPILGTYQKEVDCTPYRQKIQQQIFQIQKSYGYTLEDSMLVLKDILYHTYLEMEKTQADK